MLDDATPGRFGDKRLAMVGAALLGAVEGKRTLCLHRLARDRNQAIQFGNFLSNPAVSAQEMLVHAGRLTGQRAAGRAGGAGDHGHDRRRVSRPDRQQARLRSGQRRRTPGLFLHPVLGVDATIGGILGLVDCLVLNRTQGTLSLRQPGRDQRIKTHKQRPADARESRRWLEATELTADALADAAAITMVGDREGDIYRLFARRPARTDLLIRSNQNRALASGGLLADAWTGLSNRGVKSSPSRSRARPRRARPWWRSASAASR